MIVMVTMALCCAVTKKLSQTRALWG